LFDNEGRIPDSTSRQAEIEAILALMLELGCAQLNQALSSFASGLEGYWRYYRRAEDVVTPQLIVVPAPSLDEAFERM
jgi:hypothetical protein